MGDGGPCPPYGKTVRALCRPSFAAPEPAKPEASIGTVASAPLRTPHSKQKRKNDPTLVAKARELRDRWLERVNEEAIALPRGKYDVRAIADRACADRVTVEVVRPKLLAA